MQCFSREKKLPNDFFQVIIAPCSIATETVCFIVCGRSRKLIHDEEPKMRGQQKKELRRREEKAAGQKKVREEKKAQWLDGEISCHEA